MDGGGDALLLDEGAQRFELLVRPALQLLDPLQVRQGLRHHLDLASAQDLEAVVAEVHDLIQTHEVERVLRLPAAYARHEEELLAQSPEEFLELCRYLGHVRRRYDRGEGAVYIREDRSRARILPPDLEPFPSFGAICHGSQNTFRPYYGLAASFTAWPPSER